jgi:DNA-binding MarR family transcriptional regulator
MQTDKQPLRRDLIDALNRAGREASGLGVLLGQAGAARLGVNSTDFECLDFIGTGAGITAGDLAAATGLTTGAITGVIDRLEQAGLARRVRDVGDRRKVYVRMTPKAKRWARRYEDDFGRAIDRVAGAYTDSEIALITDYFRRTGAVILGQIEKLRTGR